jgi:endonuclease/exonuclease/phosphatase family metal-dependent hydrolase
VALSASKQTVLFKFVVTGSAVVASGILVVAAAASRQELWKSGVDRADARTLVVASLNMAKERDAETAFRDIQRAVNVGRADVLLLQEVANDEHGNMAEALAARMNRYVAFAPAAPGVTDQGLAIVSRYPLRDVTTRKLKACDLRFHSRHRIGLAATVAAPQGEVRVVNAHLDTRVNNEDRLAQITPLVDGAERFQGPKLIGGDFNTNDMYWIANIIPVPGAGGHSEAIRTLMERHGFTTPFTDSSETFPVLGLHLDWIFVNGLRAQSAGVSRVPFSDHHAIWTRLAVE